MHQLLKTVRALRVAPDRFGTSRAYISWRTAHTFILEYVKHRRSDEDLYFNPVKDYCRLTRLP